MTEPLPTIAAYGRPSGSNPQPVGAISFLRRWNLPLGDQSIGNHGHPVRKGDECGQMKNKLDRVTGSIVGQSDHAKGISGVIRSNGKFVFPLRADASDGQTYPPSGSCISPKVAEAGESETPLPGGGHGDG